MPLVWTGPGPGPFLKPDRVEHVRHDAPPGAHMLVLTAAGVPVFGRYAPGATERWAHVLRPEWEWRA